MAEGLMRHLLRQEKDWKVMSAGMNAVHGMGPSVNAVRALQEIGINISDIRSQPISEEVVQEADSIFVMTHGHRRALLSIFPEADSKTYLLREFEPGVSDSELEIPDPIGQSYFTYLDCRDAILSTLPAIIKFMKNVNHKWDLF